MRIFVATCLMGLLVVGCVAQAIEPPGDLDTVGSRAVPAHEWQRYTVNGEEFSVSLPLLPAMSTQKIYVEKSQKTRTERQLGAFWNGVVYTIRSSEIPLGQSLDQLIASRFRYVKITSRTNISINGFSGTQFTFTTNGFSGATQFFGTKSRLYEFGAVGAPTDDSRLKPFFSSIFLGGKREGTEVQDGIGAAFFPDTSGAEPEQTFTGREDGKIFLVMKPEPSYTDRARQEQITGTVVLKAVFGSNGSVREIRVVSGLPFGLTERAITAAKQIKYMPATKNGQFLSKWIQLEYNFNLY